MSFEDGAQPPAAARSMAWYKRWWVLALAAFVAVGLAVGVGVAWLSRPDGTPFEEAVKDLAAAPVVHYRTTIGGGGLDLRVTAGGDMVGTFNLLGIKLDVLSLDGKTYVKAPTNLSSGGPTPVIAGRWTTGGQLGSTTAAWHALGPLSTAARLFDGLTEAKFPSRFNGGSTLDGVAVLKAGLPDGDLYITKAAPHRVVRFTGMGAPTTLPSGLPSLPNLPTAGPTGLPSLPSLPKLPSLPVRPSRAPSTLSTLSSFAQKLIPQGLSTQDDPAGNGLSFDMVPASPADFEQTFDDLRNGAQQLASAVNANVQFTMQGNANVACGPAGCLVTATVSNQVVGGGDTKVVGAQVSAEMTATVFLNGQLAGTCVSPPTPVPAGGTGTLSCNAVQAGAVYNAIVQQANASGKGGVVIITATGSAEVVAMANVQAQVEQQVQRVDRQRQLTLRGPPGTLRTPRVGDTDGGPGAWRRVTPPGSAAAQAYQERATGVARGYEYRIGNRDYDGFENGVLIDGKDKYNKFFDPKTGDFKYWWKQIRPKNPNKPSGYDGLINEAKGQVADAHGLPIEWRVSDPQFAALLTRIFQNLGIDIKVRYFP